VRPLPRRRCGMVSGASFLVDDSGYPKRFAF
jgi:hypothetical protein